jgi:hypothetical protein
MQHGVPPCLPTEREEQLGLGMEESRQFQRVFVDTTDSGTGACVWASNFCPGLERWCSYTDPSAPEGVAKAAPQNRDFVVPCGMNAHAVQADATGTSVWPGTLRLAHYLLDERKVGWLGGKVVCELGAGTGLLGLILAAHCAGVVLTDGSPVMLDIMKQNAEDHHARARGPPKDVDVQPLVWGSADDVRCAPHCTLRGVLGCAARQPASSDTSRYTYDVPDRERNPAVAGRRANSAPGTVGVTPRWLMFVRG